MNEQIKQFFEVLKEMHEQNEKILITAYLGIEFPSHEMKSGIQIYIGPYPHIRSYSEVKQEKEYRVKAIPGTYQFDFMSDEEFATVVRIYMLQNTICSNNNAFDSGSVVFECREEKGKGNPPVSMMFNNNILSKIELKKMENLLENNSTILNSCNGKGMGKQYVEEMKNKSIEELYEMIKDDNKEAIAVKFKKPNEIIKKQ